ncbi:hypothetical protein EIP91_001053 [Steccherinum ochraceum]|uniref:DNA damage-binding protein CMR1 n=1 Tax=Steccherinum ochraceum TaxID=92696 RepID=A0A4R0RSD0_9APHY|nr:hypothetical protein EIP91_001053 [Steccherinum ochraceum]
MSDFDAEREANIARNKALLAQLDISMSSLEIPVNAEKVKAKPVQPAKRKEEEERRRKEEEERLEAEEREREAKRPRHQELDLNVLTEELDDVERTSLRSSFEQILKTANPRRAASLDAFTFDDDDAQEATEVKDLKKRLGNLKVVARAKVCKDRIYSAAYHPEATKDLIFFGDKHGQLGIWDARAATEEVNDEDDGNPVDTKENGKYWRLQSHWPATSKSSISSIKFDPIDAHSVFTTSYDTTLRSLSFTSGLSREIYATASEEILIHSMDMPPAGHEMWISDSSGGLTHLDLREDKSKAQWYGVSTHKIGSVSVNPTNPHFLLTASNNRFLRIWDARNFDVLKSLEDEDDVKNIETFLESDDGSACLRSSWEHGKSINSAYWDPRGRGIVSTCYDDKLRFWDVDPTFMKRPVKFPTSRPKKEVSHDCQTGRWLTVLKAQWSPNPDVYPHVGNMRHSLDIYSCKGELLARLSDPSKITAVQAVTCSHPSVVERAASGNGSGRCVLWAPADD